SVESGHRRLSPDLHDLEFAHDRVVFGGLIEPDDRVGDGEDRIAGLLLLFILAHQERRHLPGRQMHGKALQYARELRRRSGPRPHGVRQGTEGVDDHDPRSALFHFFDDPLQGTFQTALDHVITQVDEADALAHLPEVEERVLLLVAQHLGRGFTEDREEQGSALGSCIRKDELLRQRGLARARGACDQVDRTFRHASAQDEIEPWHTARQLVDHNSFRLTHSWVSAPRIAWGHSLRTGFMPSSSPSSMTSNSNTQVSTAVAADVACASVAAANDSARPLKHVPVSRFTDAPASSGCSRCATCRARLISTTTPPEPSRSTR